MWLSPKKTPALLLLLVLLGTSGCDASDSEATLAHTDREPSSGLVILDPEDPDRPTFFDLGRVPIGDVIDRRVRLVNREGRTLVIRDAIPSCGCTRVSARFADSTGKQVERRLAQGSEPFELAPGAEVEVTLSTDTTIVPASNAPKLVNVRLRSDSEVNPYLTFELTLIVDKPFEIVPSRLALGTIPENGDAAGRVQVVCFDPLGFEVTGIAEAPEHFEIQLEKRLNLPPSWDLTVHVPPPHTRGSLRERIVLATSGPHGKGSGRPLEVLVTGDVVNDFSARPTRLQFAPFASAAGAGARVELAALLSGVRVAIVDARAVGEAEDALQVTWTARDPDDQGRATRFFIDLVAPPGLAAGAFRGDVVVDLEGGGVLKVRIPYGGTVTAE